MGYVLFFKQTHAISLGFQYSRGVYPPREEDTERKRERERREKEKEGRERKALRAIAKGIYAMLSVTLRSPHRKIAKLFKTPLAASVLVAV